MIHYVGCGYVFWGGSGWRDGVGAVSDTWVIFEIVGIEMWVIVAIGMGGVEWWVSL